MRSAVRINKKTKKKKKEEDRELICETQRKGHHPVLLNCLRKEMRFPTKEPYLWFHRGLVGLDKCLND